jgi:hypothetical protein
MNNADSCDQIRKIEKVFDPNTLKEFLQRNPEFANKFAYNFKSNETTK